MASTANPPPPAQPAATPPAVQLVTPSIDPEWSKGLNMEWGEAPSILRPVENAIVLGIPEILRQRKIYAWLWTNPSNAADYQVICELTFSRTGRKIGSLFLSEAVSLLGGNVGTTVPTIFVAGGNVVQDTIAIYPSQPAAGQPTSVKIQPQTLRVSADSVALSVKTFVNMTGIRLWLGVISSEV